MAIRQLGRVPMMPKHIWEPLTKEMEEAEIRAYENFDPIGTGPYTVLYYDDTRIVCLRNDEYWGQDASMFGKLPAPKYITVLRWNDNAGINTAFANGELDITESFLPQVWQLSGGRRACQDLSQRLPLSYTRRARLPWFSILKSPA